MVTWAISDRADRDAPGLIPQLLDAQPRHFAAPAPAGRERQEKDREISGIGSTIRRTARDQPIQDIPGAAAAANRSADRSPGAANGPSITTVQRAPARGAPLEGFRGMGAIATQQPLPLQALGNVRGHLLSGVDLALRRIPEIMRHESQRERLGPRPWQRPAGRDVRLSLQIDEVRR
jgi:hypothetical protein